MPLLERSRKIMALLMLVPFPFACFAGMGKGTNKKEKISDGLLAVVVRYLGTGNNRPSEFVGPSLPGSSRYEASRPCALYDLPTYLDSFMDSGWSVSRQQRALTPSTDVLAMIPSEVGRYIPITK